MPAKKRKPQETTDSKETAKKSPTKKSKKATETHNFKLVVEYCKSWQVFKRKAETVVADLRQTFGEVEVEFNPSKPRRGSFEFTLVKGGKETLIWTGVKKGPPRKMKFPETPDLIIEEIKKNL